MRTVRITGFVLALLMATHARAGLVPVSKTIVTDGIVADWDAVLLNPANSAWDGDGSSVQCVYSSDRDCFVNGTEHDLARFAWTWDATNFYIYIERYGNAGPWGYYEVIFDRDRDGFAESGEPGCMLRINSPGNSTDFNSATYVPAGPLGDPMVDAQLLADGYTLQGALNSGPNLPDRRPVAGGLIFEGAIPWTRLGVPAGTPMFFHVSGSSSFNVPNSVLDNMGGISGGIGDTGYRNVTLAPPRSASAAPNQSVDLAHRVCNAGNIPDRMRLSAISALGVDLEIWRDDDADTYPDTLLGIDAGGDGDFSRSRDDLRPAGDSNSDGLLDLGVLAAGQCVDLILRETFPNSANSSIEQISVAAWHQSAPVERAELIDVVAVGKITLRKNEERRATAGDVAWIPHSIQNNTTTAERIDFSATSTRGWPYVFYTDPEGDGPGPSSVLIGDYNGNGMPDLGVAAGEQVALLVRGTVSAGATIGQVETVTVRAIVAGNTRDQVYDTVTVSPAVEVTPDHLRANGDERYGAAGGSIYFAHVLQNSRGINDSFDLTVASDTGWPVALLADPDGDGRPYDSYPLPGTTGLVERNGGTFSLLLRVDVPSGITTGTTARVTVTAISSSNLAISDGALDDAVAAIVRVYEDPAHVVNIAQAAPCSTVFAQASGLPPLVTGYRFVWRDGAGTGIRITPTQTDSRGACADELDLMSGQLGLDWYVEIQEIVAGNWMVVDSAPFDVVDPIMVVSLDPVDPIVNISGEGFAGRTVLSNTSPSLRVDGLVLRWVVTTPDGLRYLRPNGTFGNYSGAETTDSEIISVAPGVTTTRYSTLTGVNFPVTGIYGIALYLSGSCGGSYLAATTTFTVVDDADGDGLMRDEELAAGTNPDDADSDDDGLLDLADGVTDSDGDGDIDALDCDSDGDNLGDGLEAGVWDAHADSDSGAGCLMLDSWPLDTTDPDVADTDGGGVPDGVEDLDRDGRRDGSETDPRDPSDDSTADSDGDGALDVVENAYGTDVADRDTDDDGVIDGVEIGADSDGDTTDDALECDADADGIGDGVERGLVAPDVDTDVAGGCFLADADPSSTTDPTRADSDGGGVADGVEDADRNGAVGAGETDPTIAADDDADGDGLDYTTETALGTSPSDRDTDDDGVTDNIESADLDGDTTSDALTCDSDGDGLTDGLERGVTAPDAGTDMAAGCFRADSDPASTTNPALADSDGGGVADGAEDTSGDGAVSPGETDPAIGADDDSDGDGLANLTEDSLGTSRNDRDSDDDGVLDGIEAADADGDTVSDALTCDTDSDGLSDGLERGVAAPDADTDAAASCFIADADPASTTNPIASDSDGGGVDDGAEDLNRNGRVDAGETNASVAADDDSDGDGLPNLTEDTIGTSRNDRDSDDDGRTDSDEGAADSNGDTVPDAMSCDSDGDGLSDGLEVGLVTGDVDTDLAAGCFVADADPATTTNPLVADTDAGGLSDGAEDTNGNGAFDGGERDPLVAADDGCSAAVPGAITNLMMTRMPGDVVRLDWDALVETCTTYVVWVSDALPGLVREASGLTTPTHDHGAALGASGVRYFVVSAESSFSGPGPISP